MKKLISLLICICMLSTAMVVSAEVTIELSPLKYETYMRGETVVVRGSANTHVTLALYYPEYYNVGAKYIMTYSPADLANGIRIETGTEERLWPEGTWKIIVQYGEVSDSLEFELVETVDRTEEETKPSGGNDTTTVTPIEPDKTDITLIVGESETISVSTSASSISCEIDDEDVISASVSGKTITVKALKKGTSALWITTSNNYATVHVTVEEPIIETEPATEKETEKPTEEETEKPTEPATEAPSEKETDKPSEPSTEKPSEKETDKPSEPSTEKPSEKETEAPTEKPTKKPSGGGGGGISGGSSGGGKDDDKIDEPETEKPTEKETAPIEKPTTPVKENPFTDIENHWAKESILSLYEKGIINGMDEKTFAPDDNVTRAQFVTMLYKAFTLKFKPIACPFNDVNEDNWYYAAVMAAYANDITKGDDMGNFNPNQLVTRQDMAVFANRAVTYTGLDFSKLVTFDDHNQISSYAIEAVYSMRAKGVINGMTATTFEPLGKATRAQAAHIIAKLIAL